MLSLWLSCCRASVSFLVRWLLGIAFLIFSTSTNSLLNASINVSTVWCVSLGIQIFSEDIFVNWIVFESGCVVLKCALSFILLMKSFISLLYLDLIYFPGVGQKFKSLLSSLNSLYVNVFFDRMIMLFNGSFRDLCVW